MTRDNAREIAVHLIFSLGFGTQSADEVLKSELNRERFGELAQEMPIYAQYPNEKQETYIKNLVRGGCGGPCGGVGRLHRPVRTGLAFRAHPSDGLCRHAGGHV